jgi:hypothetical protein
LIRHRQTSKAVGDSRSEPLVSRFYRLKTHGAARRAQICREDAFFNAARVDGKKEPAA